MTNRRDHARTYTYDENGNRLTKALGSLTEHYSYDEADKLTAVTDGTNTLRSYTYDDAGRTTSITEGSATTSFAYDYEGRVTQITYPNSSSDSYGYNGLDARIGVSGTHGTGAQFRQGVDASSGLLRDQSHVYSDGPSVRSGSSVANIHYGLKNANSQSDDSEAVTASQVYDAFGNVVSSSGTWQGSHGYGAQFGYETDGSGLLHVGHRYYEPETGRFLTRDPSKYGENWYSYCDGQPVSQVDIQGYNPLALAAVINVLGTIVDIGGAAYDAYLFWKEPSVENGLMLAWSVGGAILPIVPGSWVLRGARALSHADLAVDGASAARRLTSTAGAKKAGVYVLKDSEGIIRYVGQSKDMTRRFLEHARDPFKRGLLPEPIEMIDDPIKRRLKEQAVIEANGGPGGQLMNQINSISRSNPLYTQVVK